jgi:hypothetical protein
MAFRKIVKDIIESKIINEEEFNSKDSKLFSDFLSNKKASEIIDGLLSKSGNNPSKALDALEQMSQYTGDGFQNREEVEKAKVGLKALKNKKQLNAKDINKLKKIFGKEWDLIWSLGTKNQQTLGLALGGVPGLLAATALGGPANAALHAATNWAKNKYVNRGLNKESSEDYNNLQRRIVEAIGKEVVYKTEDAIRVLINNDINPGFYKTMGAKTVAVFFDGSNDPYELTAVVDRDVLNEKGMIVTRRAQLKFNKILNNNSEANSTKFFSIDEFKAFIKKARETDKNLRTKKSIEFLDRYFSKNEIVQKKLSDIEVLREKLFDYGVQLIKDEIISQDKTDLSNDEKEKILDASITLERKFYKIDKDSALDFLFGVTNIDKGLIEKFIQQFINKKQVFALNWPTRIKETVKKVYDFHKKNKTLNDLLENLDINVKEAPSDEAYYWQQLIRTTYDNPAPFYSKRFMPYDKAEKDPVTIFDDEKITNRFNSNYKLVENPLLPYIAFYNFYQTDLLEVYSINNHKNELFKKFMKEDLNIDENSAEAKEIEKNINISDNIFLQYKILYYDQYKNNTTNNQLNLKDAIVGKNFVYFKNNAAFDVEYQQIKSECKKIKNNITFVPQKSLFLIDMSDTIFNPNEEVLKNNNIELRKEDINNIQRNIKSAQDSYQEVNVEKTIDNVTVPNIIVKIFDSLIYAQEHDENESHKFMYSHLFLTFLYAYSQNKSNIDFISSYDQLSKKMAEKGKKDPIFDGIMALLQQAGSVNVQKTFKENIEAYWNKVGNTIDYQDGEYRLINISSIGRLRSGEPNTSPLFVFECVSNKQDYDQSLTVNLEGLYDFIDNKALKRNTYRIYENPLPSIMNKQLNMEKFKKSNQPEEITMARELFLILDKLNSVFDPDRPNLWTGFLGAFGTQIGETIEDIFRIKSIFAMPSRIRLIYDISSDSLRFLSPLVEGVKEHELSPQEIKEIAPQSFVFKMSPYSDLIGINTEEENRKNIKTPTTKILLEDFIRVLNIEDPQQQMKEFSNKANTFSVLTSIGAGNSDSLHRKLIWLEKQGFFCTKKEIDTKIQSEDLKLLRGQLSDSVIEQFKNMKIAMDETHKTLGPNDFSNKEYMSWFPDASEMSNLRGMFMGKNKFRHHNSEINQKLGILRK